MHATQQRPAEASGKFTIGSDLTVYRLGFGSMRDKQEAVRVLRRALELGINLIDTADSYGPEVAESLIAEALYPYPNGLVIATKGGIVHPGPGPDQFSMDGRPQHLREVLEGSLRRLRLDRIAIYHFHRPDPNVPFEESVGALAAMRAEGKIRHVGLSNVTIDELARAQKIVPIVTVQNHYNLADRRSERMDEAQSEQMIDTCARQGIGFIPWSPLTAGQLARAGGPLDQSARQHNARPSQIALAWLLKRSPTMLPIPGTSSVQHLEEDVQGATIQLTQEEFDTIERAAAGQ
jgi:pyridoxine 4-dehydrogenase